MNPELNIHYGFGQIKPYYRGKDVLVVSAGLAGAVKLDRVPMLSPKAISITENPNHNMGFFSVRTYVGVNALAEKRLNFCAPKVIDAFELDREIVSEHFVDQTLAAVKFISQSGLRMAVVQGS